GLVPHLLLELVRQAVAVDRGLDHQRGLAHVAPHREPAADRRGLGIGSLGDLAHHHLPDPGVLALVAPDLHVAQDPAVVRHHEADAGLLVVAAQQPGGPALEDLDDHAFAAPAGVDPGDAGHDPVAMHGLAHLVRRQEQVVAGAAVRAHEAEAVGVSDHGAGDQLHLAGGHVAAAPVPQQLAVADHGREALFQGVEAVGLGEAEHGRDLVGLLRALGLRQRRQDRLAAGDGILVAPGLALGVGIVDAALPVAARLAGRGLRGFSASAGRRPAGGVRHPGRTLPAARGLPSGLRLGRPAGLAGWLPAAAAAALAWGF